MRGTAASFFMVVASTLTGFPDLASGPMFRRHWTMPTVVYATTTTLLTDTANQGV
jgi:hypothetical protein